MRIVLISCIAACGTFSMDYRTSGEQRIGQDVLDGATAVWRCEGGERIGLIEQGRAIAVASQDLIVRERVPDVGPIAFRYERPHRQTLQESALAVTYLLPADLDRDLLVLYATETVTDLSSSLGCSLPDGRYKGGCGVWYSAKRAMLPLRTDACWRERAGEDRAAQIAKLYVGAHPVSGPPPANAARFPVRMCTFNENRDGIAKNRKAFRGQSFEMVTLNRALLGAEDTVLVPQDIYLTSDPTPRLLLVRPDHTGIELTNMIELDGERGWLFERAGRPVFVNMTPGRRSFYVFPPNPPSNGTPAVPRHNAYYIHCWIGDGS